MRRHGSIAGLVPAVLLALAASPGAAQDRAAQIAKLKDQMKTGYVGSCVPEAKKSSKATDEVATTYCKCSVSFVDDMGDDEFLDLVNSDLKKERPKNDTYLKMMSKMDSCKKAATGG